MLRRRHYGKSVTDGWTSLDPLNNRVLDRFYKKQVRELEKGWMYSEVCVGGAGTRKKVTSSSGRLDPGKKQ